MTVDGVKEASRRQFRTAMIVVGVVALAGVAVGVSGVMGRSEPAGLTPDRSAPYEAPRAPEIAPAPAAPGPRCSRGCPCGNSCIDCSKTCRGGGKARSRRR